ncbi:exodeoxyribonuclease VII large subunit [Carnobacteriaceae bacterium zg-ZUI252]|nr:exodeoxyribonuclease VII large subunit [Carnobacteriaceae bacterium zg-ZUI252]MBS4770579.1 exodeoxyribonuclease VII large subunit [Carnobacteriaceae bacterium zg-ZUI240]
MNDKQYLSVGALYQYINRKFVNDPYLKTVYVVGEASNVSYKSSGYIYFNLKDDKASIKVVSFVFARKQAPFKIEDGQKLLVVGHVSTYDQGSNYQIQMTHFELAGIGALFEELKALEKKLRDEGLFDLPKKAIPRFPKRIAILTSETGAVREDIETTVRRRYPIVALDLYPTVVQGKNSVSSILHNLQRVLDANIDYDTVIIGRGGGSIEDLWSFNDEKVVRAVSAFPIPIISSVGHQTDTTLIDYVADVRAATPTAAAEIATRDELTVVKGTIDDLSGRLLTAISNIVSNKKQQYNATVQSYIFRQSERLYDPYIQKVQDYTEKLQKGMDLTIKRLKNELDIIVSPYMHKNPGFLIEEQRNRLDRLEQQLRYTIQHNLLQKNNQFEVAIQKLDALSPLKSMQRGYSIVNGKDKIVSSVHDVKVGDSVVIDVTDGRLNAQVTDIEERK